MKILSRLRDYLIENQTEIKKGNIKPIISTWCMLVPKLSSTSYLDIVRVFYEAGIDVDKMSNNRGDIIHQLAKVDIDKLDNFAYNHNLLPQSFVGRTKTVNGMRYYDNEEDENVDISHEDYENLIYRNCHDSSQVLNDLWELEIDITHDPILSYYKEYIWKD